MFTDTGTADAPGQPTGPRTPEGKRVAARNATTHGLFARDIVLPHLGEDPEAYEALLAELTAQLRPRSLLQRHYVEKIAAASWRLRRLQRWQAQLFEDAQGSAREVLAQLDSVMRHETTLHRQIDSAVRMLGRELPHLSASSARQEALDDLGATEDYCARNPGTAFRVAMRERELLDQPVTPPGLDLARLDTATAPAAENSQNGPDPESSPCCEGPLLAKPRQRGEEVTRNETEGGLFPRYRGPGGHSAGTNPSPYVTSPSRRRGPLTCKSGEVRLAGSGKVAGRAGRSQPA